MRRLNIAAAEVIAYGRPVCSLRDRGLNAILLEEAFFMSDDNRRAIRQGNHPEIDRGRFRPIVGIDTAYPVLGQARHESSCCRATDGSVEKAAAGQLSRAQ